METTFQFSPEQKELSKALCTFRENLSSIQFDKKVSMKLSSGGVKEYQYTSLAHILEKIKEPMKTAGLGFVQIIDAESIITRIFPKESNEFMQATVYLPQKATFSVQDFGSMVTYIKRYSLCSILGIAGDEDDDANEVSEKQKSPVKRNVASNSTATKKEYTEAMMIRDSALWVDKLSTGYDPKQLHADILKKFDSIAPAVIEKTQFLTPDNLSTVFPVKATQKDVEEMFENKK